MIRGHTTLSPSGPNTKLDPTKAKSSSRLIDAAERLEDALPGRGLEHEQGEEHLQAQAPRHRAQVDGAAVGRQRVGDRHDHDQPDERLDARHAAELQRAAPRPSRQPPRRRQWTDRGCRTAHASGGPGARRRLPRSSNPASGIRQSRRRVPCSMRSTIERTRAPAARRRCCDAPPRAAAAPRRGRGRRGGGR